MLISFPQGRQPFLLNLLSLYKVFCPELVTLSIPSRSKVCTWNKHVMLIMCVLVTCGHHLESPNETMFSVILQSVFKNHNMPWKSALIAVQKRNGSQVASSISLASASKDRTNRRKRVWEPFQIVRCNHSCYTTVTATASQCHTFYIVKVYNVHYKTDKSNQAI